MSDLLNLSLTDISINGGTQARTEINQSIVAEYAEAIRQGVSFPPVVVFEDGVSIWLADGFHRYHAHKEAGAPHILCDVINGTQRQAVLYSLTANANHGLRRTNEDKRKAVMTLLNDAEWNTWSNVAISKACGVSDTFVGDIRKSIIGLTEDRKSISAFAEMPVTRTVERNGKTYEQNTANIGKNVATPKPENQEKPSPVINPTAYVMPGDKAEYVAPEVNFEQMYHDAERENDGYLKQIESLTTTDKDAELIRLNKHIDQLSGHLNGETNTKNEAQKQAKYFADLLAKIRKVLNVESNSKILAALEAR